MAHAPRQRLRALLQQCPAGGPEQQKAPRPPVGIHLGPQVGKQIGQHLHFVQHHQPVTVLGQEEFRLGKLRPVGGSLQVEEQRARVSRRYRFGQRGLAYLARAQKDDAGVEGEAFVQQGAELAVLRPDASSA